MAARMNISSGGGDEDDDATITISSVVVAALMDYFDKESLLNTHVDIGTEEVFESASRFFIEWGPATNAVRSDLFNSFQFRTGLRVFMARARAYLHTIGAVPMWYTSDIGAWLHSVIQRDASPDSNVSVGMPFGVLEPYECEIVGKRSGSSRRGSQHVLPYVSELVFGARPTNRGKEGPSRHRYTVFNLSMHVMPASPALVSYCQRRMQMQSPETTVGSNSAHVFVPRSAFYDLMNMQDTLAEMRTNAADADWSRAHPRVMLAVETPTLLPASQLSQHTMFETSSLFQASAVQQHELASEALARARIIEREQGDAADTIRNRQRHHFRRPDTLEGSHIMDPYVRVASAPDPVSLADVPSFERVYATRMMLVIMGAPDMHSVEPNSPSQRATERRDVSGVGRTAIPAMRDRLGSYVRREQSIYVNLFAHIYRPAFGYHDMVHVAATALAIQAHMAELDAMDSAANGDPAASAAGIIDGTVATDGDRAPNQRLRVLLKDVRRYLAAVAGHRVSHANMARLVFEPRPIENQATRINILTSISAQYDVTDTLAHELGVMLGTHVRLKPWQPALATARSEDSEPRSNKRGRDKTVRDDDSEDEASEEHVRKRPKTKSRQTNTTDSTRE